MFSLFRIRPGWESSEFSGLPEIPPNSNDGLRDELLIAGGLALVLSRCPPGMARKRFSSSMKLYAALSRRKPVSGELLSDVSHEIAEFADRPTRDAVLRRMRAAPKQGSARPSISFLGI